MSLLRELEFIRVFTEVFAVAFGLLLLLLFNASMSRK
jgi:hypothetical protein